MLGEVGNWLRTGSLEDGGRNHLNAPLSDPQSSEGDICWSISQHARIVRGETHVPCVLQPLDPQQEPLNTQKSLNSKNISWMLIFHSHMQPDYTGDEKSNASSVSLYEQGEIICCKECHSCTTQKPLAQHYLVWCLKLTSHREWRGLRVFLEILVNLHNTKYHKKITAVYCKVHNNQTVASLHFT